MNTVVTNPEPNPPLCEFCSDRRMIHHERCPVCQGDPLAFSTLKRRAQALLEDEREAGIDPEAQIRRAAWFTDFSKASQAIYEAFMLRSADVLRLTTIDESMPLGVEGEASRPARHIVIDCYLEKTE